MPLALTQLLARLDALPPRRGAALGLAVGVVVIGMLLGPGHWLGTVLACVGVVGAFVLAITGQSRWEETAPSPPPAHARPQLVKSSLLGHMIPLPAGSFIMGSDAFVDERPPHRVRLSAFDMAATPVTIGHWNAVMRDQPQSGAPNLPVTRVCWLDAIRFCNAASVRAGLRPAYVDDGDRVVWDRTADGYRLPTEAEWEYACRAGTVTRWSCGDDLAALEEHAWFAGNAGTVTHPVATKRANPWGLHDMHGNVWEWCWDVYDSQSYHDSDASNDPTGPVDDMTDAVQLDDSTAETASTRINSVVGRRRVIRGGSFLVAPEVLRSSYRDSLDPKYLFEFLGFRCVRGAVRPA